MKTSKQTNPYRRAYLAEHALAIVAAIALHMPREATADALANALESWTDVERMGAARAAGVEVEAHTLGAVWALVVGAFRGGVKSAARAA